MAKPANTVSIHAGERGFPRVSFDDGKELNDTVGVNGNGAPGRVLASADFDSDGTADLIVADSAGGVRIYRGNVESIYPNSSELAEGEAKTSFSPDAFHAASDVAALPLSPDFIAAGDFNADGHSDILAAARGGDRLYVMAGNGAGGFAHTTEFGLGGSITGIVTGRSAVVTGRLM